VRLRSGPWDAVPSWEVRDRFELNLPP
jgi:hypothetical protein